ncbi:MAG TPA: hypothetical protein VF518_08500, partial [Polyangia bacterium]
MQHSGDLLNPRTRHTPMSTNPPQTEISVQAARRRWAALVLAVFALGILLRLPTFLRPLWSDDEAIYATTADALVRGDLLYRDVVDHKPPLIYHVYQAGFAALGAYNTHGAHALVVLAVLLTGAMLLAIRRQEGHNRAGLASAGLFLIFSTTWHDYDALAANCELFVLAFQAMAARLLVQDFNRPGSKARSLSTQLGIGLLIGIATLFKYQGLTFLGVSVGMLAWAVFLGRLQRSRAVVSAALQVGGSLIPALLYLAWCAAAGNAQAALNWFLFNFSYVDAGLKGTTAILRGLRRTGMIGGAALPAYALGIAGAATAAWGVFRALRHRARGASLLKDDPPSPASVLALLWLCTSAFAVSAGGRFFGHYFHLVLAPLCLLSGPRLLALWSTRRHWRAALVLLHALPALFFFALASFARPLAVTLDESQPNRHDVAARMAALTSPDERVFVWGNSPQLYWLARRPMGSRFSFCNYMTGESPGTPTETGQWNAEANQLPTAWKMLFADLESRKPALFVDTAAAGWNGYDKFPVTRYPHLATYLHQHYRPVE